MKLYADPKSGKNIVTAHGPGWVAVNGRRHERSLLLSPDRVDAAWGPERPGDLTEAHLTALAGQGGEVLILGTGSRQRFPSPALLRGLVQAGFALEVMDTGAACRTYNILVGEGRAVIAGLIVE